MDLSDPNSIVGNLLLAPRGGPEIEACKREGKRRLEGVSAAATRERLGRIFDKAAVKIGAWRA
jgi:hypothetical protein